ncbi:MAG: AraC family transcriptional regulator [Oscillospiraceae bacterium]|nr:AraC family transcriptional regulator [Oscillospiraceae bacterium]MDD4413580.1 AraC family transcriptional regulator [Oscillospiraceae bacterium]
MTLRDKNGTVLVSLDDHVLDGSYNAPQHTHHSLEISCVVEGTGKYVIDNRSYDLQKGDIIIINNTEQHRLVLSGENRFHHIVIHFDPSFIWNSLSNDLDYNFLLVFFERGPNFSNRLDRDNPATACIYALILDILEEFNSRRLCYELIIKIKLQTIFTEILRNYDYIDRHKVVKPLSGDDILNLNTVMRYIDSHLDSDISLKELADIIHISPAYFSTLFKRFNGVSPIEYIINRRVQRAIELIKTTSMSLTEIAISCGFNNGTNFYKAFNKVTGRTPASYRRNRDLGVIEK